MTSAGQAAIRSRPNRRTPHQPQRRLRHSLRVHLAVYVPVNLLLIGIWAASGVDYFWPVWTILGWGIFVAFHAAPVLARARPASPTDQGSAWRRTAPARATSADDNAARIGGEHLNLRAAAALDGTVTIMFSDIEASTALNERLGDIRWLELLRTHHAIVRDEVRRHAGHEVKAQGDGFMVAFASARRAVQCAGAIQRAIDARLGEHPDGPIRLRIGLHTGEAMRDEADFYGKNVVLAARIADQARGGEILASSVVKQLTESAGDVRFDKDRRLQLKGLAGAHTLYRVI
jgi:class 3 adenylate cyclase